MAPAKAAPPLPPLTPGRRVGLDKRTHEKLRRGRLAIEGSLDLHGHTLEAAHRALVRFIEDAHAAGKRRLLVITGKGRRSAGEPGVMRRATLRLKVPLWLNEPRLRPLVLAVEQAQPRHGGAGALYVMLRRPK